MKFKGLKTKLIVTALTVTTALSGVAGMGFSASAAAPEPKEIIKDLTEYTVEKVIGCVPGGDIVQDLLNKGAGYILGWVFDEEPSGENGPSTQDIMDRVQQMSDMIDEYHKKEMDMLKLINANIDSGDFRKQADSIGDDYKGVMAVIRQNQKNITTPGSGVIDKTTYRAYKTITEDATCDAFDLAKNFNIMKSYIMGSRSATNRTPGYNLASQYLMQKVLTEYKEKNHDWTKSLDFLEILGSINRELESMQANVVMDGIALLTINNMRYKIHEYEIVNGIDKPKQDEDPYLAYRNYAKEILSGMKTMNDQLEKAIRENNENRDFVQAIVELPDAVGGKKIKGFHSFEEAWVQAYMTNKDFSITGYKDVKAVKKYGYNTQNLDWKYGYTALPCGYRIKAGRKVSVDLTGHTFDSTGSNTTQEVFGPEEGSTLTLKNAKLIGGDYGILVKDVSNVAVNLENVTIQDTRDSGINFRYTASRNNQLHMKNCVVKNCKNSAVYLNSSSWLPLRFTIDHCRFEGNQAKEGGGAFFCKCVNDTNTITNCEFINNASYHSCGGALNVGMAVVKNCEFRGNRSEFRFNNLSKGAGGAIYAEHLTCIDSRFYDNKTNDQAGAIMLRQVDLNRNIFKNRVEISGCTFSGNYAPNVGGAIRIWAAGTRADQFIKNNTFSGNYSKKGKAVFIEKATKAYQDVLFSTNHGTDCGYNGLVVLTELK